jgi:hypothetical protein
MIGPIVAAFVGGFTTGWWAHKTFEAPKMVKRALDGVEPQLVVRNRIVHVPIERIRYVEVEKPVFIERPVFVERPVYIGGGSQEPEHLEAPQPAQVSYPSSDAVPIARSRRLVG